MPTMTGAVIVVDDDAAVRNALKFALEMEGLTVRTYSGGPEVLAAQDIPERGCLVVDYHMATMDGLELVRRLRQRDVRIPAILITGKATDDMRRSAESVGFLHVLEKPLDDGSLVDGIRGALTRPS